MTVMSFDDSIDSVRQNPDYGYNGRIHDIRREEYSHLGRYFATVEVRVNVLDTIYLDHAGATPYPISVIHDHSKDLDYKSVLKPPFTIPFVR